VEAAETGNYRSSTIIDFLNIDQCLCFYLSNISETGVCFHPQVVLNKERMMYNVQKINNYINLPSSMNFQLLYQL
jgi:hypothetical protein